MKTDSPEVKSSSHAPPSANPATSPLRLAILLGVFMLVAGALLFDRVIAPPRVNAANDKLHDTVLKHNERGLKRSAAKAGEKNASAATSDVGGLMYSEDIQEILGMAPTRVEKTEFYTIEHYRWWGWIPRNTNFITVLYVGDPKRRHYSTHYANELPEDGSLPGKQKFDEKATVLNSKPGDAPVTLPAGPSSGMFTQSLPKAATESAKKGEKSKEVEEPKDDDESKKSDEPAKAEAAKKAASGNGEKKEPAKEAADESK
ncbi:MAG: hypothetical protein IAF94_19585 [Pirellulaceae bacterium]|nr:hypothetical protein [Pirellulaceae bacterium]